MVAALRSQSATIMIMARLLLRRSQPYLMKALLQAVWEPILIGFAPALPAIALAVGGGTLRSVMATPFRTGVVLPWFGAFATGARHQALRAVSRAMGEKGREVRAAIVLITVVRLSLTGETYAKTAEIVPEVLALAPVPSQRRTLEPHFFPQKPAGRPARGPERGLQAIQRNSRRVVVGLAAGMTDPGGGGTRGLAAESRNAVALDPAALRGRFFGSPPRPPGAAPRRALSRGQQRTRDGWRLVFSSGWRIGLAGTGRPMPGTRTPRQQVQNLISCA